MNDVNRDAVETLTPFDEFTLADLEAIRLILRGDSVIDWRRLDFVNHDEVRTFLAAHELGAEAATDLLRIERVKGEAVAYLRRQFDYPIPRPIERATGPELILLAS